MSPIYLLALSWAVVYKTAPFAGWALNFAAPAAQAAQTPDSAPLAFNGEAVDSDLPTIYRLPPLPPSPATTAVAATEATPLFSPPSPPEFQQRPPAITQIVAAPNMLQCAPSTASQQDQRTDQRTNTQHSPAGSPPDERTGIDRDDVQVAPPPAVPQQAADGSAPVAPIAVETSPRRPMTTDLDAQLLPAVQRAYVLARRGALFAARTEFVQVLRRVAQAKDMAADSDEHSQALAAGLRALDEADDFVPEGVQLEAELDVRATASSHRTPVLAEHSETVLPHEAVALYHDFAQEQLANAVAAEQAGSMALYGLGRIDAQLAARKDERIGRARMPHGPAGRGGAAVRADDRLCPQCNGLPQPGRRAAKARPARPCPGE
jgi:hypothetical protein